MTSGNSPMIRVLMTGGPGVIRSRVILRLVAAGREVRTMLGSPTRAAEKRVILDTGDIQSRTRMSFFAKDRDDQAGRLDAAAGCEFVDDRIRRRE